MSMSTSVSSAGTFAVHVDVDADAEGHDADGHREVGEEAIDEMDARENVPRHHDYVHVRQLQQKQVAPPPLHAPLASAKQLAATTTSTTTTSSSTSASQAPRLAFGDITNQSSAGASGGAPAGAGATSSLKRARLDPTTSSSSSSTTTIARHASVATPLHHVGLSSALAPLRTSHPLGSATRPLNVLATRSHTLASSSSTVRFSAQPQQPAMRLANTRPSPSPSTTTTSTTTASTSTASLPNDLDLDELDWEVPYGRSGAETAALELNRPIHDDGTSVSAEELATATRELLDATLHHALTSDDLHSALPLPDSAPSIDDDHVISAADDVQRVEGAPSSLVDDLLDGDDFDCGF